MFNQIIHAPKAALIPHWIVVAIMLILLVGYIITCRNMLDAVPPPLAEAQRIGLRTLCYIVAIILFPLTNLIRHIQLRLNQTIPGDKPAHKRYLLTVIVSMCLIHSVGILGVAMFIWGDGFNTLYILVGLSALGAFLYRPKWGEYVSIVEAVKT